MTLPNSSSALVWQIVKKSNAFAVRGRTGDRPRFSRERGNLMSLHSFKHSGEKKKKKTSSTKTRRKQARSSLVSAPLLFLETRGHGAWPLWTARKKVPSESQVSAGPRD